MFNVSTILIRTNIYWALTMHQTCPKPFTCFNSFNPHNKPCNYPCVRDKKGWGKLSSWLFWVVGLSLNPDSLDSKPMLLITELYKKNTFTHIYTLTFIPYLLICLKIDMKKLFLFHCQVERFFYTLHPKL